MHKTSKRKQAVNFWTSVVAIFLGSDFSGRATKAENKTKENKTKKQLGLHQTKSFYTVKGNHQQNKKATY